MPTGPGAIDAEGIYQFGELDDPTGLFSDTLNLGMESVSDAFRNRVKPVERRTHVAVDAAARDAFYGVPASAAARRALQDSGATCLRLDLGYEEQYYAGFNDPTALANVAFGVPVAGWYPVAGAMWGNVVRSAAAFNIPNAATDVSANANWTPESGRGIDYANGWPIPVTGIYEMSFHWFGGGAIDAYAGFGVGATPDIAWNIDSNYGSRLTVVKKLTAGDLLKAFARASTVTAWSTGQANGAFSCRWLGVAKA